MHCVPHNSECSGLYLPVCRSAIPLCDRLELDFLASDLAFLEQARPLVVYESEKRKPTSVTGRGDGRDDGRDGGCNGICACRSNSESRRDYIADIYPSGLSRSVIIAMLAKRNVGRESSTKCALIDSTKERMHTSMTSANAISSVTPIRHTLSVAPTAVGPYPQTETAVHRLPVLYYEFICSKPLRRDEYSSHVSLHRLLLEYSGESR